VVIPVYNSQDVIVQTVEELLGELAPRWQSFEIVLVDDHSLDGSWSRIKGLATRFPQVQGVRLLRNSGQHSALLAGMRATRGDFVVLMDDDGQNPPAEIPNLIAAAQAGPHDLVFGVARDKQHARTRNLGSVMVDRIIGALFDKPRDVRVSNYKLLSRPLVDRVCAYAGRRPYINGEALLYCESAASVPVEHRPRQAGKSQYSAGAILKLLARLIFGYSVLPLRATTVVGLAIGGAGLLLGLALVGRALVLGSGVPGWTSLVVMFCTLQSIALIGLAFVGEYSIRALRISENQPTYVVSERSPS
jgi:undecaprenyl-phosphate 4-deoxy-4-formamido-L-arabinose transferase